MKISHLVVAGCSWTYCQGLKSPRTQGWPSLIAKELGVPVINLALPGIGNDAIHRRTYEYAIEDSIYDNYPLYIIAWTQTWRREAWCRHLYNKNKIQGYHNIAFPDNTKPINALERGVLETWSEEDFFRRLMLYRLSIDALFSKLEINYLNTFFAEPEFNHGKIQNNGAVVNNVKDRFNVATSYLENKNLLNAFHAVAGPYPKTECGHEGPEGNKAIADYVINYIKENNKEIIIEKRDHLSLINYYQKTDPSEVSHLEWV